MERRIEFTENQIYKVAQYKPPWHFPNWRGWVYGFGYKNHTHNTEPKQNEVIPHNQTAVLEIELELYWIIGLEEVPNLMIILNSSQFLWRTQIQFMPFIEDLEQEYFWNRNWCELL